MIHKRFIDKCLKSIPLITEYPVVIESTKSEPGFFSELIKNGEKMTDHIIVCRECEKNKELLRQEYDLTNRISEARDIFAEREKAAKRHIESLECIMFVLEFIIILQFIISNLVLWSK